MTLFDVILVVIVMIVIAATIVAMDVNRDFVLRVYSNLSGRRKCNEGTGQSEKLHF